MKSNRTPVAITLTEYVFGASGERNYTRGISVPVSRIIKATDQAASIRATGLRAQPIYRTSLALRTPEEYLNIVESHTEIAALMNGESAPHLYTCTHLSTQACIVFEPEQDGKILRKMGAADLCDACVKIVNENPDDPRQVRPITRLVANAQVLHAKDADCGEVISKVRVYCAGHKA